MNVLISDLDGTLLNDDGTVPDSFVDLLNFSLKSNILLLFASSRSPQNIQLLFSKFNFEFYSICSDGSSFVKINANKIEIIKEINHSYKNVIKVFYELLSLDINPILFFTNHCHDYEIFCLNRRNTKNEVIKEVLSDGRKFTELSSIDEFINNKNKQEVSFIRAVSMFDRNEIIENIYYNILSRPIMKSLKVYKYRETRFHNKRYSWIDIIPRHLSKGLVVSSLRSTLLKGKFIIALGNDINDKELFKVSNLSFCPMNSNPELIKLSGNIINRNNGEEFIKEVTNYLISINS
jgi:hypothetical protein